MRNDLIVAGSLIKANTTITFYFLAVKMTSLIIYFSFSSVFRHDLYMFIRGFIVSPVTDRKQDIP